MAAPMLLRCLVKNKYFSVFPRCRFIYTSGAQLNPARMVLHTPAMAESEKSDAVEYPPIKPKYPPGRWEGIHPKTAWKLHERSDELRAIPTAKLRLETMAGDTKKVLWLVEPMDRRPNNLEMKRYLTRTHIIDGLPEVYKGLDVESAYSDVRSVMSDLCMQELKYAYKAKLQPNVDGAVFLDAQRYSSHRLMGVLVCWLRAYLAKSAPHLLRSQLDENVRVETFWDVCGFAGKEKITKGRPAGLFDEDEKNLGILRCQYREKADWQIRVEQPLPQIVPRDDVLCSGQTVPQVDYTPASAQMIYAKDRPISVSGHWIGAPCEWNALSVHVVPTRQYADMQAHSEKVVNDVQLSYGIATGFGSCVAQAHNQGFCYLLDITYPITTQCIVTDGNWARLFVYQLNTLELWKEYSKGGNPRCNVCWVSPPMPLYETLPEAVEGSKSKESTKTFSSDVVKLLLRCLTLQPGREKDLDLRPYLDPTAENAEPVPVEQKEYINKKGEPVLPRKKIGRFEYPKNAIYF